jgi:NTP pyrophosphatase (non-canonical NTP hydrolase)
MGKQERVGQWGQETFPQSTPRTIVAHLGREVRELEVEVLADHPDADAVAEEAADCLLLLYHLAHRFGFSLHDATAVKFSQVKARAWGKPDAEGVVEHVR